MESVEVLVAGARLPHLDDERRGFLDVGGVVNRHSLSFLGGVGEVRGRSGRARAGARSRVRRRCGAFVKSKIGEGAAHIDLTLARHGVERAEAEKGVQ